MKTSCISQCKFEILFKDAVSPLCITGKERTRLLKPHVIQVTILGLGVSRPSEALCLGPRGMSGTQSTVFRERRTQRAAFTGPLCTEHTTLAGGTVPGLQERLDTCARGRGGSA